MAAARDLFRDRWIGALLRAAGALPLPPRERAEAGPARTGPRRPTAAGQPSPRIAVGMGCLTALPFGDGLDAERVATAPVALAVASGRRPTPAAPPTPAGGSRVRR